MELEDTIEKLLSKRCNQLNVIDNWEKVKDSNDSKNSKDVKDSNNSTLKTDDKFEIIIIQDNDVNESVRLSHDIIDVLNLCKKLISEMKVVKEEMNVVKDEMKGIKEEMKGIKEEMKISSDALIKSQNTCIPRVLTEREKNHFVRSHIPFRFIPEHTLGFPFG